MRMLPAAAHAKLSKALAAGTLPDEGDAGDDDVSEIHMDLASALDSAWSDPNASTPRRHVSALIDFWLAVPGDGLLVGVAVNQPGVVAAAIKAAQDLKLPGVLTKLKKIQPHIPAKVLDIDDAEERFAWYESAKGQAHAEALEDLESDLEEAGFINEIVLAPLLLALKHPAEFFKPR